MTPRDPTPGHNKAVEHDGHVPTPGGTRPVSARPEDVVRSYIGEWDETLGVNWHDWNEARDALAALVAERDEWKRMSHSAADEANENDELRVQAERERDEWKARAEALEDDEAVMRGYDAVSRMLIMRVGGRRDHAEAFRAALQAVGSEEAAT